MGLPPFTQLVPVAAISADMPPTWQHTCQQPKRWCVGNEKSQQLPPARGGMSGQEQQERMHATERERERERENDED